jgi:hypothetical protein
MGDRDASSVGRNSGCRSFSGRLGFASSASVMALSFTGDLMTDFALSLAVIRGKAILTGERLSAMLASGSGSSGGGGGGVGGRLGGLGAVALCFGCVVVEAAEVPDDVGGYGALDGPATILGSTYCPE